MMSVAVLHSLLGAEVVQIKTEMELENKFIFSFLVLTHETNRKV